MKRVLLFSAALLCASLSFAQLQETFDPAPSGWILSQGAHFESINGNGGILTPGVGGNNPAQIGTPAVSKTSNTFEVCINVKAYTANLNSAVAFPCNTYMDVLFVKSTVNNANSASQPANILARVDNYLLPANGGSTCFNFTFPAGVTDASFKVFISFHSACSQSGIKYFIDDISLSGVNFLCEDTNCPPGTSADVFNRPAGELSFNAVLWGSPIDVSYPSCPTGYAVDLTGTDEDQNDSYPHLKWSLVSGPSNGTVVINSNGMATITRNAANILTLTFTYVVCDDGPDNNFLTTADNMTSPLTTVTVNWAAGMLPVTLINFTAAKNKNNVTLKWETATENGNAGFEVYRNADNAGFQKVGYVASKAFDGNSSAKLSYEFNDLNLVKGVTQYRLKQIDLQGKASMSEIRTVKGDGSSFSMSIYPTPSTTGDVTVAVSGLQSFDMYITDMSGHVVKQLKQQSSQTVKITNLGTGMYIAKIVDLKTGEQTSEKIVVTKR